MQKLLCEMQVDFICTSKYTRTNAPSSRSLETIQVLALSLAKGVLRMRTARGIICTYNWIADYAIDRFQSREHFTIGRHIGAHVNSELVSREL